MEFFDFMRGLLAWLASVACPWPFNVPMLYFAQRIREGQLDEEHRIESGELWTRATLGALAVALTTAAFVFADLVLADWAQISPGVIHFVMLLGYVFTAAFVLMYFFAFDDYFFGLGLFTLYLGLPVAVLYVLNLIVPIWSWLVNFFLGYLARVPN